MRLLPLHSLAFCLFFFPITAMAIVNMNGLHFGKHDKTLSIDVDVKLSGSSGNSDTQKTSVSGQFSWTYDESIHLAIFGHQYGESNDVQNLNKSFAHYRYIHSVNKNMDWELFTQLEKNEFTRLSYRALLGAGLRFNVFNSDNHHAYLGSGIFHAKEETSFAAGFTDDGVESFERGNIYFLSQYTINPTLTFSNAIYYQPRLDDSGDFRALLDSKLDIKLSNKLSFRISLEVEHDNKPSQTIEKTDVNYLTGITYRF